MKFTRYILATLLTFTFSIVCATLYVRYLHPLLIVSTYIATVISLLLLVFAIDIYKRKKKNITDEDEAEDLIQTTREFYDMAYVTELEKKKTEQVKTAMFTITAEFSTGESLNFSDTLFIHAFNQAEDYACEHRSELKHVYIKRITTVD